MPCRIYKLGSNFSLENLIYYYYYYYIIIIIIIIMYAA